MAVMLSACSSLIVFAQQKFNGIDANLGNLYRLSDAKSRSISPENFNGEKGKGGMATTGNGAKALRVPDFQVAAGAVADLVVLDARDAREAFATRSPRRWVIRKGKLIAEGRLEKRRYFGTPERAVK